MAERPKDELAAQGPQPKDTPPPKKEPVVRTVKINNEDVPLVNPASRAHASEHVTAIAVKARQDELNKAKMELHPMAKPEAVASSKMVPVPPGGLLGIAEMLYPEDLNDNDAMQAHVLDLWILNRDMLRNDTSYTVGQMVRVPG